MLRWVIALIPHRRMTNEPTTTPNPVKQLLQQILDSNGDTPTVEKERAIFIVLSAIYDDVHLLKERVVILEANDIVLWMKSHKAEAAAIALFLAVSIMAWHDSYPVILRYVEQLAGLKSMIKP